MNKNTTKNTENTEVRKKLNGLTKSVIGAAIEVHRALGPGLLESAYEICFCRELNLQEIRFQRQVPIPLEYKGVKLDCGSRSDVIVEETLLLELKAVDALRDGIRRRVLNSGPHCLALCALCPLW